MNNLKVKINDEIKNGTPYVKVEGAYRKAVKTYVKVNGVWKTK